MASKTVCTMTADIPGEPSTGFYGEHVYVNLFDEQGNEIWMR